MKGWIFLAWIFPWVPRKVSVVLLIKNFVLAQAFCLSCFFWFWCFGFYNAFTIPFNLVLMQKMFSQWRVMKNKVDYICVLLSCLPHSNLGKLKEKVPLEIQKERLDKLPLMGELPQTFQDIKCNPILKRKIFNVIRLLAYLRTADEKKLVSLHLYPNNDGFLLALAGNMEHQTDSTLSYWAVEGSSSPPVSISRRYLEPDITPRKRSMRDFHHHYGQLLRGNSYRL